MSGNDSFTKLLLHCDGADTSTSFLDASPAAHTVTAAGNGQVDTAQSVFGGASYLGDGTGDYLTSANNADWNLGGAGAGDFTLDFRVRFASVAVGMGLLSASDTLSVSGWNLFWSQGLTALRLARNDVSAGSNLTWSPSVNVWYHVAVVRSGSTVTAYIDGTSIGTFTDINMNNDSQALFVGAVVGGSVFSLNGWMDEVRISKGIARWTANFTPPAAPYSDNTWIPPRRPTRFFGRPY